jgi:hypothetical protein
MKAELVRMPGFAAAVIVREETSYDSNCVVLFQGQFCYQLAQALVTSVEKNMCPECGGFNGDHRENWVKTGQDGFGSVEGFWQKCNTAKVKS